MLPLPHHDRGAPRALRVRDSPQTLEPDPGHAGEGSRRPPGVAPCPPGGSHGQSNAVVARMAHHRHRHRRRARGRVGSRLLGVEPVLDGHRSGLRGLPAGPGPALRGLARARRARHADRPPARAPSLATAFLAAAVSWLLGAWWGLSVLWYGVLQGLAPEASSPQGGTAPSAAGVDRSRRGGRRGPRTAGPVLLVPGVDSDWKLAYLLMCVASSALIAGLGVLGRCRAGWPAPECSMPSRSVGSGWAPRGLRASRR